MAARRGCLCAVPQWMVSDRNRTRKAPRVVLNTAKEQKNLLSVEAVLCAQGSGDRIGLGTKYYTLKQPILK